MRVLVDWVAVPNFCKAYQVRDERLMLTATYDHSRGEWIAGAISSTGDDVQGVLDDHAHKVVGKYDSLDLAKAALESFARSWSRRRRRKTAGRCECEEIR